MPGNWPGIPVLITSPSDRFIGARAILSGPAGGVVCGSIAVGCGSNRRGVSNYRAP